MSVWSWSRLFVWLLLLLTTSPKAFGKETSSFQRIFQTEETVRKTKANEIRGYINLSADPCTDFYEYACGNWRKSTTPLSELVERTDQDLMRLLKDSSHREDSALARQAKEFYKSCLVAQAHQSQQQQNFLSEFIQQNGGFPAVPGSNWNVHHHDYDWLRVLGGLRQRYGFDILIGLRVGYNHAQVQENSIYFSEPNTLLPHELCSRKRLDIRDEIYEPLERKVASQLRDWLALDNEESGRLAADLLSFEHELCGGMRGLEPWDAELRLFEANYTRKTLPEFSQLFGINLEAYVSAIYNKVYYKPVYMAAPDYYRQLQRTVAAHNMSQVANYIMYRAVSQLTFSLEDRPMLRSVECLAHVKRLLPTALGELYARQYANEESEKQLDELFSQLQDSLKQSLSVDWLEEGSRRLGQRKLAGLKLWLPLYEHPIAYKLQLERSNYWHNLDQLMGAVQSQRLPLLFEEGLPQPSDPLEAFEARMRYRPVQRRLDLGLARLQPPDYDARYGNAISYATLGVTLAQQMVLAFDDLHWSTGLLEQDNWDGLTAWRYHNRTKCFSQQVEDYVEQNVTATKQLIRDSAALNVAFRAYLSWLGFQQPNNDFVRLKKETLPGINHSNTALFFVAYAQQYCQLEENRREESEEFALVKKGFTYSVRQNHSWVRLRINGPLQNMAEFSREFHCTIGTPMNPADKCTIY